MKTNYQVRYAAHPEDAKSYDTERLRRDFLIEQVFTADEVNMVYSMYDRMVVGGAMPVSEALRLEAIDPLKAPYFLTRRELGIFNVGGAGTVKVGNESYHLDFKEALCKCNLSAFFSISPGSPYSSFIPEPFKHALFLYSKIRCVSVQIFKIFKALRFPQRLGTPLVKIPRVDLTALQPVLIEFRGRYRALQPSQHTSGI